MSRHKRTSLNAVEWAASLVTCIGDKRFFSTLADQLQGLLPHDFCVIMLHSPASKPAVLFDGLSPQGYWRGLQNFLSSSWVVNPFSSACWTGLEPGLHSMQSLLLHRPERSEELELKVQLDPREELGFVTEGWPRGMREQLVSVPLSNHNVVEISLSRERWVSPDFALESLRELAPIVVSSVRRHCQLRPRGVGQTADLQSQVLDLECLTAREQEVIRLVLDGYSSQAITQALAIALPTVKTHRRNAYRKLGVASQVELFSLVMHQAEGRQPSPRIETGASHPLG